MKLLLDQNLSYRLVNSLQDAYPETSQCYLLGLDKSDDYAVWKYAKDNKFTIVTKDSDFHELSLIYGPPPKVIWLKCGNKPKSYILTRLLDSKELILSALNDTDALCVELY